MKCQTCPHQQRGLPPIRYSRGSSPFREGARCGSRAEHTSCISEVEASSHRRASSLWCYRFVRCDKESREAYTHTHQKHITEFVLHRFRASKKACVKKKKKKTEKKLPLKKGQNPQCVACVCWKKIHQVRRAAECDNS